MFSMIKVLRHRNRTPTHGLFDTVRHDRRVGLTDIDFNLHLNNVKYLKYMEQTRLEHLLATGLLWRSLRAGVNSVIANTEISYIRELRTWQPFTVTARIVGWDEKYFYYEQRFESEGRLCTHAFIRLASLHRGKSIPMARMLELTGFRDTPPPLPEPALRWREMLASKRDYALAFDSTGATRNPSVTAPAGENRHVA
ncbi:MAG: acyl-CoA thioesterase [Pseudomonadota bacterium]